VTTVEAGLAVRLVFSFPFASDIAKVLAEVTVTVFGEPRVALAVMCSVQIKLVVWSIETSAPLETLKSIPAPVARLEQSSPSFPFTLKVISLVDEFAALAANVAVGAKVSMLAVIEVAAVLEFPATSVIAPAATDTEVVPVKFAVGVNVAEYEVPLPAKFEMVPLVTTMSPEVNVPAAAASLSVNEMTRV
jgi:hypothetical protein